MTTVLNNLNRSNRRTIARLQDEAVEVYLNHDTNGLERIAKRVNRLRDDLDATEYTKLPYRIHHIAMTLWDSLGYAQANRRQYLDNLPSYTPDDLLSPDYDPVLPHSYNVSYIAKAIAHVASHVPYQEREDILHDLYLYILHKRPSKIWYFWPCATMWLRNWWKLYHYRQHYGRSIEQLLDTDDPTDSTTRDHLTILSDAIDTCQRIQDKVNAQHIYQSLPTHIQKIARKRVAKRKLTGHDWANWEVFAHSEQAQVALTDL